MKTLTIFMCVSAAILAGSVSAVPAIWNTLPYPTTDKELPEDSEDSEVDTAADSFRAIDPIQLPDPPETSSPTLPTRRSSTDGSQKEYSFPPHVRRTRSPSPVAESSTARRQRSLSSSPKRPATKRKVSYYPGDITYATPTSTAQRMMEKRGQQPGASSIPREYIGIAPTDKKVPKSAIRDYRKSATEVPVTKHGKGAPPNAAATMPNVVVRHDVPLEQSPSESSGPSRSKSKSKQQKGKKRSSDSEIRGRSPTRAVPERRPTARSASPVSRNFIEGTIKATIKKAYPTEKQAESAAREILETVIALLDQKEITRKEDVFEGLKREMFQHLIHANLKAEVVHVDLERTKTKNDLKTATDELTTYFEEKGIDLLLRYLQERHSRKYNINPTPILDRELVASPHRVAEDSREASEEESSSSDEDSDESTENGGGTLEVVPECPDKPKDDKNDKDGGTSAPVKQNECEIQGNIQDDENDKDGGTSAPVNKNQCDTKGNNQDDKNDIGGGTSAPVTSTENGGGTLEVLPGCLDVPKGDKNDIDGGTSALVTSTENGGGTLEVVPECPDVPKENTLSGVGEPKNTEEKQRMDHFLHTRRDGKGELQPNILEKIVAKFQKDHQQTQNRITKLFATCKNVDHSKLISEIEKKKTEEDNSNIFTFVWYAYQVLSATGSRLETYRELLSKLQEIPVKMICRDHTLKKKDLISLEESAAKYLPELLPSLTAEDLYDADILLEEFYKDFNRVLGDQIAHKYLRLLIIDNLDTPDVKVQTKK